MTLQTSERSGAAADNGAGRRNRPMLGNDEPLLRQAWHPVAEAAELADAPLRVELLGEAWLLLRRGARLLAFPDRCPHRRAALSRGRVLGQQLECAYHGWRFSLEGDDIGRCVAMPVLGEAAALPTVRLRQACGVHERYGLVWLAPEEPLAPLPQLDALERAELEIRIIRRETPVAAGVVVDNFLDVAHFSYLHASTFGLTVPVTDEGYAVSRDGWTSELRHETVLQPAAGQFDAGEVRTALYSYTAPFTVGLTTSYAGGSREAAAISVQPAAAGSSVIYVLVAWDRDDPQGHADQVDFSARVLDEDLSIVESISDPRLPLDLRSEFHLRADRAAVEMRKILGDYLDACQTGVGRA